MGADLTCFALIAAVLALLLSAAYWYITRIYGFFDKLGISGPLPSFPFGTWNKSARSFLGAEDIANAAKYGSLFGTFDGLKPNLLTTDPKLVKEILVNESLRDRRAALASNASLRRVLRILSCEDEKSINALLSSSVKQHRIAKLVTRLETTTNSLIRSFLKNKDDPKVAINGIVADYVQDTSALALLGIDLNQDPVFRQVYLKQSQRLFSAKNTSSPLAILPQLYGGDDSWILPKSTLEYFRGIIVSTIKERGSQDNVESKAPDFVDILLEAARQEKQLIAKEKAQDKSEEAGAASEDVLLTEDVLADQILAAILILNHWTKSVIIFGVHALAARQEVQEKLYQEVKAMEPASYDVIQSLPYLDMVLSEVLRCHTPEFRLEKISVNDVTLKEDLTLPKGTVISIPLFALHQSKEIYQNPAEFRPERFSSEKVENRTPPLCLPFGQAGDNASNIGQQLGILAAKLALFKIASKLKVKPIDGEDLDVYQSGITGVPQPAEITVLVEPRV